MTTVEWLQIGLAGVCAVIAACVAASEAALTSFSRARAQGLVDDGRQGSKRLLRVVEDLPSYLNAALFVRIGVELTTVTLVAHVVFAHVAESWLPIVLLVAGMLLVSFLLWGVLPRTLGRQHADAVALAASWPLVIIGWVVGPLVRVLIMVGNTVTPGHGFAEGPFSSEAELREVFDEAAAADLLEAEDAKMIASVFGLGETVVRNVMVPRTDMVYIDSGRNLLEGMALSLRTGFSRIPVITENGLDDVVGILHVKDLMKHVHDHAGTQGKVRVDAIMREPMWTPESKPVDDLLREMQVQRKHMAIVVDEFDGTAGLVTIEDILEEIVGEIIDEYDTEAALALELASGRFRVSSRLPVSDLGELFGIELDDDDVETVGGLMAKRLGRMPVRGSSVEVEGIELTADRTAGPRQRVTTFFASRVDTDAGTEAAAKMLSDAADTRATR